jgi:signal transduction histidine kinase/DNA-binding response OmpR family regulator
MGGIDAYIQTMIAIPTILLGLILATAALLGGLAWALSQRARRQLVTIAELNQTLERTRDEAAQQKLKLVERSDLDIAKDEFISTVSHELRTPLTSIRGALGLLSAGLLGNVDAKAQNLLRIASTNTERLIRLINDILDLERMESGRAPLRLRRCSLYDLAKESLETMTSMADEAGIRLELVCFAQRDAVWFDGDPDRVLQVVTNLLSNAIKFSPANSAVALQIDADLDSLLLKVVDQGRGIPVDKLDAVFDRFQQVESADAKKKGGTGLGLAICRSIVQQHGGAIWAQSSNATPGTTMYVQFTRASRMDDASILPQVQGTGKTTEGLILVCDDDASIRAVVSEQLQKQGYEVIEAISGQEAITIALRNARECAVKPDVLPISAILLDLHMPGLSGWETLQQLKSSSATATIPVVILSVVAPTDHPIPGATPQGWVQKPFNEALLITELSRVLHTGDGLGHVLLVEDDEDLAQVVIAGFEQANVRVDHASTRQQAMDHCMAMAPDLLILDLTLPDGDGFSLIEWLRRQPEFRSLPLVVYSGREISDLEMLKLRLGPTQFLTKAKVQPKEVEALVLAMVQRLRRSNMPI